MSIRIITWKFKITDILANPICETPAGRANMKKRRHRLSWLIANEE